MSRKRTVFPKGEVAHLWANQSQDEAREAGGRFWFSGPTIYSYSTEMGRIVTGKKGATAYLLNDRTYTHTTSEHQSRIRSALSDAALVFEVDGCSGGCVQTNGREIFNGLLARAAKAQVAADAARAPHRKGDHQGRALRYLEKAQNCALFFGLKGKKYQVGDETIKVLAAKSEANRKAAAKVEAARQKRLAEAERERLERWIAGEDVPASYWADKVHLRVCPSNPTIIETSKGATILVETAKRLWDFLLKVRATGWHRNGETFRLDSYSLDAVNAGGIVAGCHRVAWDEIERLAGVLGLSQQEAP